VRSSEPVLPVAQAFGASEPSFTRDALARSAYRLNTVPEATIELSDSDLQPVPPPLRSPERRPAEKTMLVGDEELMIESQRGEDER